MLMDPTPFATVCAFKHPFPIRVRGKWIQPACKTCGSKRKVLK